MFVSVLQPVVDDLVFGGNFAARRNTVDGVDNGYLQFAGGGAASALRGGYIQAAGNEHANAGQVRVFVGNVAGSAFIVYRTDESTLNLSIDGNVGRASFNVNAANAIIVNSQASNGGYIVVQRSSVDKGYFGSAFALSGIGDNNDMEVLAQANLYVEAVGSVRSLRTAANTTASAANVFIDSVTGDLKRSTSSARYKADVAPMSDSEWRWLLAVRPVTFQSIHDDSGRRFGGLLAEDVAQHGPVAGPAGYPLFAILNADGEPDEVAYAHLTAPIIAGLQNHESRLAALEGKAVNAQGA